MWTCPKCERKISDLKDSCPFCKIPKPRFPENYCLNPNCSAYMVKLNSDQERCDKCGKFTLIGKTVDDLT